MTKPMLNVTGIDHPLAPGDILDTASGQVILFDQLIDRLADVRVVYVGEQHTHPAHHEIQLRIIKALVARRESVRVGMEMFDHTYQQKLDQWSAAAMDWPTFLKQVHWYANWRYKDTFYKDILMYVRSKGLTLVGLNVPFHLPPKIAIGGLESLLASERALLPDRIDTSNPAHRAYVQEIFEQHRLKGRDDFDNFYAAQCTWEDGMAQAIADNLSTDSMVVLAGNGHIVRKFGIPERAFARTQASFRTVYLAVAGDAAALDVADFIWVTPADADQKR